MMIRDAGNLTTGKTAPTRTAMGLTATVLLLGLLVFAGTAQGQIAAPRLNTVIQAVSTPFNPAVLSWNERSLVTFGVVPDFTVEDEDQTTGTITPIGSGDGVSLGVRLIGDTFSFAAEVLSLELDVEPLISPPSGGKFEIADSLFVLSAKLGDTLSAGIGVENEEETTTDNATGFSQKDEGSLVSVGGVWMLGDTFFLGGSFGSETVKTGNLGPTTIEADHNVSRIGAGWYWRDGSSGFHAEIYRETSELIEFRDNTGILFLAEEAETTGVTLEVLFSNIMLGIESINTTEDSLDPFGVPALVQSEEKEITLTLGWMPEDGLSIALSLISSEETDDDPFNTSQVNIAASAIGVSWAF